MVESNWMRSAEPGPLHLPRLSIAVFIFQSTSASLTISMQRFVILMDTHDNLSLSFFKDFSFFLPIEVDPFARSKRNFHFASLQVI
jgi:hypothetical protein